MFVVYEFVIYALPIFVLNLIKSKSCINTHTVALVEHSIRLQVGNRNRKEIEENEYEVQNYVNFIFKAVTIHRYRDVCLEMRCVCEWVKHCPVKFLDDTFLNYIKHQYYHNNLIPAKYY